ncbi:MAG TPA: hypothetical protein VNT54_12700 [Solirubrobacteraceae bacterium]|nr:hypothetical protein [Solirubrobacteraceae bacterium]
MASPALTTGTPGDARRLDLGTLLVGAAALLLFVSLFLDWYQPGIDAWSVFEAWDLVLALLAVVALVAVASRLGFGPPRPPSWLLGPALAALVIVVYAILDPPPATNGLPDGDPATGLWLALVAAVLLTAGAVLSVARISVAITTAGPASTPTPGGAADPPAGVPTRRPSRFMPGAASPPGDDPPDPGATPPPTEPTRRL